MSLAYEYFSAHFINGKIQKMISLITVENK